MEETLAANPAIARMLVDLFRSRFDTRVRRRRRRAPAEYRAPRRRDRGRARPGGEPRRGPDPAHLPRPHPGHAAHQRVPARRRREAQGPPVVQARPGQGARPAAPAADVRDLRVLAADGGRAPPRRPRRPRWHPLVGPAGGLPHRDPRAHEGPDGEERRHRARGRQGRVRRQAAAGRRRPRGPAGRGGRLLPDADPRDARHHRQPASRAKWCRPPTSCATTATTRTSSWRPTRARPRSPTSPTPSRPSTGSGWATPSPRAARPGYDHKAMGITARGAWESVKRHFRGLGVDTQSDDFTVVGIGDMSGDVFGNGMLLSRQHPPGRRVRPPPRVPRPGSRRRRELRRAPAAVRAAALVVGRLRPRRCSRAAAACTRARRSRSRSRPRCARRSGCRRRHRAGTERPHQGHPAGAGRPAVERRHRDVREGAPGDARRRRRPHQRRRARRRHRAARQGGRRRREPRVHPAVPDRVRRSAAGASTPTPSTTRPASTAPTTR